MRMHGRMRMRIYRQTYMRIDHLQIVYNEPNGISPSYLIKMRTANLNDAQLWKSTGYKLGYVILYVDIWSESVSSVWAVRSMAFLYFYENSPLICCIFQLHSALSKFRKAAMEFVFRLSFFI